MTELEISSNQEGVTHTNCRIKSNQNLNATKETKVEEWVCAAKQPKTPSDSQNRRKARPDRPNPNWKLNYLTN